MRTFNRTIILVIGAGAVLALTGLAQAESRHMRSRRVMNRGFISQPTTFRHHNAGRTLAAPRILSTRVFAGTERFAGHATFARRGGNITPRNFVTPRQGFHGRGLSTWHHRRHHEHRRSSWRRHCR